jgi:hypothetical protein
LTLVYLGCGLRVNARATFAQGTAAVAIEMQANLGRLAESSELAAAFNKAGSGQPLDEIEATQLRFWLNSLLGGAERHVLQTTPEQRVNPWANCEVSCSHRLRATLFAHRTAAFGVAV